VLLTIIGPIFLVVGVGLLAGCFGAYNRTKRFLATAREARAEVVGIDERHGGSSQSRAYHPVLRYRTQEGVTKEIVSSVGSNPPRYKKGDSVAILYDPARPDDMRIHSFGTVWLVPLILAGVGGIFIIVGIVLTFVVGR
jgi:hypothetical protein